MGIVQLTRPDGSHVIIVVSEIVSFAAVPVDGPMAGPLKTGTRIEYRNHAHQDVKEDLQTVASLVSAALIGLHGGLAAATFQGKVGAALGGVLTNVGGHPDWPGKK